MAPHERLLAERQNRRSLVNFGVVATARALGDRDSTLLRLCCECGAADCSAIVEMRRSDYEHLMTSPERLLVAPAYATKRRVSALAAFVILRMRAVTGLLIVNLALFLPVVVGGIAMSWFGWTLAGRHGEGNGGGGRRRERGPAQPPPPWPVRPGGSAGPDDLARSA